MISSVHTHSHLCDGKAPLADMAQAAFEAGAAVFGASGHSHTPVPHDAGNTLPADPADYRAEVLALREEYRGRMEVLLGIEMDSCAEEPVPAWADYWIGSVHNLYDESRGVWHSVDWDAEKLAAGRDEMFSGDMYAMAEGYFADVAAMAARKPTILGHIDLITKLNEGGAFFDETHPRYRSAALAALHAADPTATLLEINTGAMSRGFRSEPYPAGFLLREWRAMGGRVILTADAHTTAGIVYAYDHAADLARSSGFACHTILTMAGLLDQPL